MCILEITLPTALVESDNEDRFHVLKRSGQPNATVDRSGSLSAQRLRTHRVEQNWVRARQDVRLRLSIS